MCGGDQTESVDVGTCRALKAFLSRPLDPKLYFGTDFTHDAVVDKKTDIR